MSRKLIIGLLVLIVIVLLCAAPAPPMEDEPQPRDTTSPPPTTTPPSTEPTDPIAFATSGDMRLGFWLGHPLGAMNGRSVDEWFTLMFLTEPYPSWCEILLTDFEKWSDPSNSETRRYAELLTLADAYPNLRISFMLGFRVGAADQGIQLNALDTFCAMVDRHPSCLSVGIMSEYPGFDISDRSQWEALRNVVNGHNLRFISYRVQGSGGVALTVSDGFHDVFHTNYPCIEQHKAPVKGDHTLWWGDNPVYYVGISAGYWDVFPFPGTSDAEGLTEGWTRYVVDTFIDATVDVADRSPTARQLVALCPGFSTTSFSDIGGASSRNLAFNPTLRQWIWNNPEYRAQFLLSVSQ